MGKPCAHALSRMQTSARPHTPTHTLWVEGLAAITKGSPPSPHDTYHAHSLPTVCTLGSRCSENCCCAGGGCARMAGSPARTHAPPGTLGQHNGYVGGGAAPRQVQNTTRAQTPLAHAGPLPPAARGRRSQRGEAGKKSAARRPSPPAADARAARRRQRQRRLTASLKPAPAAAPRQAGVAGGRPADDAETAATAQASDFLLLWAEYLAPGAHHLFFGALPFAPASFKLVVRTRHPRDVFATYPAWPEGVPHAVTRPPERAAASSQPQAPPQPPSMLVLPPSLADEDNSSSSSSMSSVCSRHRMRMTVVHRRDPVRRNLFPHLVAAAAP